MKISIGSTTRRPIRSGYRAAKALGPSSQKSRMRSVRTTVSIASATFNILGSNTNRETIAAETVAAPMLEKLFPNSSVASSLSGASSQLMSFRACLLPWEARCRTLYLLLAKIAVSESEKNADNAKKASSGRIRIVSIKGFGFFLSHRNFAARFGDGFLDAVLNFQFGLIHDGGKFGNEEEPSPVQHPLLAEGEWLNPAEIYQILKDFGDMEDRTGAHFLR